MPDEDVFPGNSQRDKKTAPEEKKVTRVTTAEPIRRKKGLGRKLKSIFFNGDPKATASFIVQSVLIPAAKDMIVDAASEGVQKLVRGDSYRRRTGPSSGPQGYVAYNRMGRPPGVAEARPMRRPARARHDFDEIVLQSRQEAETVIEQLYEIISKYDTATVSDLYDLVGIRGTHVDHKWGWTDMRGAGVVRVRDGFLLELPDVQPMEM